MRVNIYAEEMTDRIEIIEKQTKDGVFTGVRFYLELPVRVPHGFLPGRYPEGVDVRVQADTEQPTGCNVRGPFIHRPGDDDSAAVTFWGKAALKEVLRKALDLLENHP